MSNDQIYIENLVVNIFIEKDNKDNKDKNQKNDRSMDRSFDFFERAKELSKRKHIKTDIEKNEI